MQNSETECSECENQRVRTMAAFRWIDTFLFLMLVLQFTVTVQTLTPFNATVGVSVQLPCKNLTDDQCKSVIWLFGHSDNTTTLFEDGKIRANSDQLNVASNCSLNIKTVSLEDAGLYTCRLFRSGQQHGEDTVYDLSVVDSKDTKPATIKATTTTTITSKSKRTSTSSTTTTTTTKATSTKAVTNTSATATNNPPTKQVWRWWWWVIIASVGLAVLIIIAAVLIRWKRAKGKRTPMDENMADPADGVCYASISYSKTTNSNALVQDKDYDEDDAVTYSTVKTSSSSAGASADPSDLYATVNKPKR